MVYVNCAYTLSEAWSGVNWADLMAVQGAFGTDFYDRSILRPKHRAYITIDLKVQVIKGTSPKAPEKKRIVPTILLVDLS